MFEAFLIVLSAGVFVAHAFDAYRTALMQPVGWPFGRPRRTHRRSATAFFIQLFLGFVI